MPGLLLTNNGTEGAPPGDTGRPFRNRRCDGVRRGLPTNQKTYNLAQQILFSFKIMNSQQKEIPDNAALKGMGSKDMPPGPGPVFGGPRLVGNQNKTMKDSEKNTHNCKMRKKKLLRDGDCIPLALIP